MWSDPNVTQLLQILENQNNLPGNSGGPATTVMQRAGLLRRLRFYFQEKIVQTAATGAPAISVYGPLGGMINRLSVVANGQIPLFDCSGFGTLIYNEIQNKDGSMLAPSTYLSGMGIAQGDTALCQYTTPGTGAQNYTVAMPIEILFGLPVNIRQQVTELGLWLLQGQAIDLAVTVQWNPVAPTTATQNAPYSGGTGLVATATLADSYAKIERELYELPNQQGDYPNLAWAHQVQEFVNPFTGSVSIFNLPKAGLLLRGIVINLDSNGNPVSYTDVNNLQWIYGANTTPIARPGVFVAQEYEQDYNRYIPKGALVLDFYKWGDAGLKLVKNTEALANLRIQTNFTNTSSGTQLVILDRLVPVMTQ